MSKNEFPFRQEGYQLMGAAFEVYNENGGGLMEEIYQESLEFELESRGIPFRSKQDLAVFYKGRELKKRYIPDLYVHGSIIVELKAVTELSPRTRSASDQLHAHRTSTGWLPDQFRASGYSGMEAVCPV